MQRLKEAAEAQVGVSFVRSAAAAQRQQERCIGWAQLPPRRMRCTESRLLLPPLCSPAGCAGAIKGQAGGCGAGKHARARRREAAMPGHSSCTCWVHLRGVPAVPDKCPQPTHRPAPPCQEPVVLSCLPVTWPLQDARRHEQAATAAQAALAEGATLWLASALYCVSQHCPPADV